MVRRFVLCQRVRAFVRRRKVMYNVVTQMDMKKRAALIRKFIVMAEELRKLGNLNGVFAVVAALARLAPLAMLAALTPPTVLAATPVKPAPLPWITPVRSIRRRVVLEFWS